MVTGVETVTLLPLLVPVTRRLVSRSASVGIQLSDAPLPIVENGALWPKSQSNVIGAPLGLRPVAMICVARPLMRFAEQPWAGTSMRMNGSVPDGATTFTV